MSSIRAPAVNLVNSSCADASSACAESRAERAASTSD
ncbi:Uncharacterised protein [Vibrio cholerae]|nr:Uncharacterised protein [Vibrio cholerae]CSI17061.1 Uncharacterised protein [Vibrio cholerae]